MARLTWTGWLGVVGLCLMLTLAIMPKTRWLVKLHGYAARGSIHLSPSSSDLSYDDVLQLIRPNNPANPKEELVNALLTRAVPDGDLRRSNLVKLADKYPNNALIQAVACRYLSMLTLPRPDKNGIIQPPQYPREHIEKRLKSFKELATCASRGISADPDNLYFDLTLACAKIGERKIDEARAVIHKALKKQSYNEYGWDECNLLIDLMKGSNDYGAYMRLQVYAGLILPYYANIKSMSICLMQTGTDEQKRQSSVDLLLVADTVSSKVDTLIGILVMRAVTGIALVNTFHHKPGEKPTESEYLAAIEKLQPLADARYPKGSSPSLRNIFEHSSRLAKATQQYTDENSRKVEAGDPAAFPASPFAKMKLSLGILLVFAFLLPAALMQFAGQKLRQHAGPSRALPLLSPVFLALVTREFSEVLTGPNYTSLMALSVAGLTVAFVLAWFERFAKVSFWVAMGVSAVGLLYGVYIANVGYLPLSYTSLMSLTTLAAVFGSRDKGPAWFKSVLSGVLVLLFAGLATLNLTQSYINSTEWVVSILVILLAATVGPVRPNAGRRIVGPSILAASVVFALLSRQMVAIDQQADLMTKTFMTEVQQVRQMAQNLAK